MSAQVKDNVLSIINDLNNGPVEWQEADNYRNGEPFSVYDYLQDVLDINWILDSNKEFKGVRLLVAFGGPNIWIDTSKGTVEGVWWGDSYTDTYDTNSEFARELEEALGELYAC